MTVYYTGYIWYRKLFGYWNLPPISPSHHGADRVEGRSGEFHLKSPSQHPQTAREPENGAPREFSKGPTFGIGLCLRFFSSSVGWSRASSWPTQTHPCRASALISNEWSSRSAACDCVSSNWKLRLFKSENIGSIPQRHASSRTVARFGGSCMAMLQDSGCPGSCHMAQWVHIPA